MLPRELIKKVRRIELVTRRLVNPQLAGQYHSVFKGRGMDFDEVLPYVAGDDVRFIDWNVSARTGHLHVKRFVEERELTVQIVVDTSSSMMFGTARETKRLVAAQVAAVLAVLAIKNNDRVGLTLFDEDVDIYIPPKKGKKHVLRVITEILEHQPRGAATNLEAAPQYVRRVTKRRAIIFVISDFLGTGFENSLSIVSNRHDVVPVIVQDLRESHFDAQDGEPTGLLAGIRRLLTDGGLIELDDLEAGSRGYFDLGSRRHRRRFAEHVTEVARERDREFSRLRLDTIRFHTDLASEADYVRPLAAFFQRRARRH